jgi:hypothetical protein
MGPLNARITRRAEQRVHRTDERQNGKDHVQVDTLRPRDPGSMPSL